MMIPEKLPESCKFFCFQKLSCHLLDTVPVAEALVMDMCPNSKHKLLPGCIEHKVDIPKLANTVPSEGRQMSLVLAKIFATGE